MDIYCFFYYIITLCYTILYHTKLCYTRLCVLLIQPYMVRIDSAPRFLETRDFGPLPKNTNDGNSREFPIVEEYVFAVSVRGLELSGA